LSRGGGRFARTRSRFTRTCSRPALHSYAQRFHALIRHMSCRCTRRSDSACCPNRGFCSSECGVGFILLRANVRRIVNRSVAFEHEALLPTQLRELAQQRLLTESKMLRLATRRDFVVLVVFVVHDVVLVVVAFHVFFGLVVAVVFVFLDVTVVVHFLYTNKKSRKKQIKKVESFF
jgi:hypothetical protein